MAIAETKRPRVSAFRIVDLQPDLLFESKQKPGYIQALNELGKAGDGKVLEFDNPGARPSIYAAARKNNLKVVFAELKGKLYCRLVNTGLEQMILDLVQDAPRALTELEGLLNTRNVAFDQQMLSKALTDLSKSGHIQLVAVGGVKRWKFIK
jgi:hypothetical protein